MRNAMQEPNTTRRRVVQGAGVIGVAGLAGGSVVTAQEGGGTDGDQAAIRVAHASPDAPSVDVTLSSVGGETGGGDGVGNETGDGTGNETGDGVGNETGGGAGGNGESAGVELTDLGFGEVSSYNELDPGTYRVEVVVTDEEGLLGGILSDLFGGDEGEGTVVYDQEVEIESGTTYTVAAYGQVSEGPATGVGDGTGTGNETSDGVGNETGDGGVGNETDTGDEPVGGDGMAAQGFQVEVLEDDLSAPAEGMARVRVFHAVPDAGPVSISMAGGGAGDGMGTGNETGDGVGNETGDGGVGNESDSGIGNETDTGAGVGEAGAGGQTLVEQLEYGATETFEAPAGDYTLQINPAEGTMGEDGTGTGDETGDGVGNETGDGVGNETGNGVGGDQGASPAAEADVSLEAGTVYSAFAVGYLDPESVTIGDPSMGGNETDGGLGNESDGGLGNETGDGGVGNETETGNETGAGNETGGAGNGGIGQDGDVPGFQLVVVQTSQDGERSEGGTGGLLDLASAFGA